MATNSLQSLNYHHHLSPLKRLNNIDSATTTTVFLKPTTTTTNLSLSTTTTTTTMTFSLSSPTTPTPSTSQTATTTTTTTIFDLLKHHLSSSNFREADEETRRLLIELAGESAQKRGYVFFSEVKFIRDSDLKTIDELWISYSDGKFGYSVQKKLWLKSNKDFTSFFIKVGWMKKLDTEVLQYNYRAFPNEFTWELGDGTPEGHLPLTNALRGTQLMSSILTHPAFEDENESEGEEEVDVVKTSVGGLLKNGFGNKQREFKTDYSF